MGKSYERSKGYESDFKSVVIDVNRVTKVNKGGRQLSFSALVVIGNGKGLVGFGIGKSKETQSAIAKASKAAKKNLIKIPISKKGGTIPHNVAVRYKGSEIFMRRAVPGTGIKAGGVARSICEVAGIENIISKFLRKGSKNNNVRLVFNAFSRLRDPLEIAKDRGVTVKKVLYG